MIQSRKELQFYIAADRIMNGLPKQRSLKEVVINLIDKPAQGVIINYLRAMRKYAYYRNTHKHMLSLRSIPMLFWHRRWNRLGIELGFSIGPNSLGYGAVLPHNGTIIVNGGAHIGNFAVIHTSTCIAGGDKEIGDFFYLSSGSQLVGKLQLGAGVSVAAHSLVNRSFNGHCLLAGIPAEEKRSNYPIWIDRDGVHFQQRVAQIMQLEKAINQY